MRPSGVKKMSLCHPILLLMKAELSLILDQTGDLIKADMIAY